MDLLSDLTNLIHDLREDQFLATSESPATAEEKIDRYEALLHTWRTILYSQVGILRVLHVLEVQESFAALTDPNAIERDAQQTLHFLSTQKPEPDSHTVLLVDSERLGDQLQESWQALENKRGLMLTKATTVLEHYTQNLPPTPASQGETPGDIRCNRDRIQQALDAAHQNLIKTHETEIGNRMALMDAMLPELRELKSELRGWKAKSEELEKCLHEQFGILPVEGNLEIYDRWLQDEVEYVASILDNETSALSLLFFPTVKQEDSEHWSIDLTPKRDWTKTILLGLPGAEIKSIYIRFKRQSMMPIDIKLKADMSSIDSEKIESAQAELLTLVNEWRAECYVNPDVDPHRVVQWIVQHAWKLLYQA